MRYGYARVSSPGQQLNGNSLAEQEKTLIDAGAEVVISECFTGTKLDRPKFTALIGQLRSGDTLIVTKLDRFARATDAIRLIEDLIGRGVTVNILNIGIANATPTGKLMISIILAFAEYERDMIWERTQEGKAAARLKPDYREGRKPIEVPDFPVYAEKVERGEMSVSSACIELGISRNKWYRMRGAA
ncbi:MAG: recombinase family protein [Bacteroidaceae bacterium]|nr:recombinase family protein [Bacteroidaceae bacterium]